MLFWIAAIILFVMFGGICTLISDVGARADEWLNEELNNRTNGWWNGKPPTRD